MIKKYFLLITCPTQDKNIFLRYYYIECVEKKSANTRDE